MSKTLKASGREYQRSPAGAPDGTIGTVYPREQNATGEFKVANETERSRFYDGTATPFTAAHVGRFVTFIADTPPTDGSVQHGSELEQAWTYRIKSYVGTGEVGLEGFRAEFAGTGISYVIHAAFDFSAASAAFPEDKGPTGLDTDGVERTNTAPVEWSVLHFPAAANDQLQMYPFLIGLRISATQLRVSDPYDNLETFPTPVSSLQWHLRDRPAYTHEQLYKIIHQFLLHCGWEPHQHRGKNNGAGTGGDSTDAFVNCVQDWIYFSDGEDGDQSQYLRFGAFHRMNTTTGVNIGTDANGNYGFDWAFYSAWDRDYAPINLGFGAGNVIFSNNGNGINALSSHKSASANNRWAAQADGKNETSNHEPAFSPDSFALPMLATPFALGTKWGSPYHKLAALQDLRPNALNTFEGGDIQEIRYFMFGDKDEVHFYFEAPGFGAWEFGLGNLKVRADANGNNFKTNFTTDSSLGTPRIHVGGPGTADGTDPTGTTPPYQIGDRIQTVGQTVKSGIVPATSHNGEFIESSTIVALPGIVQAQGRAFTDTGANVIDGGTFTIDDGESNPASSRDYEWDSNASMASDIAVTYTGGDTADQMRDNVIAAINPDVAANLTWNGSTTVTTGDTSEVIVGDWIGLDSDGQLFEVSAIDPNVDITLLNPDSLTIPSGSGASASFRAAHGIIATDGGAATVDLLNAVTGGKGNIAITESVAEFTALIGMGGGGYAIDIAAINNDLDAGALVGEDPQALFFFRPSLELTPFHATAPTQGTMRVSNRSGHIPDATYRDHNGPGGTPGSDISNGFDVLVELSGLSGADTREVNPNKRTGRFSLMTVNCRDTTGGQLRGSMRYCRMASANLGAYQMKRDRNGDWHLLLPFGGRHGLGFISSSSTNQLISAFGPMPTAMAFVG